MTMIMIDRHSGSENKLRKCNVGCIENLVRLIIPRESSCICISADNFLWRLIFWYGASLVAQYEMKCYFQTILRHIVMHHFALTVD
jgi:hypothetical protein